MGFFIWNKDQEKKCEKQTDDMMMYEWEKC